MKKMSKGLKITLFIVFILGLVLCSYVLAQYWNDFVDIFISSPKVRRLYEATYGKTTAEIYRGCHERPDVPFVSLFLWLILVIAGIYTYVGKVANDLRVITQKQAFQVIALLTYSSSLFYCLFVFFINFKFGIITMALFLWPILLWRLDKINFITMIAGSLISIVIGYATVEATVAFMLLIPTLQLISIRAKNAISSRYVDSELKISTKLTSTQKQNAQLNLKSIRKIDLWDDVIEPELNELVAALGMVTDFSEDAADGSNNSIESAFDINGRIKRSLVAMQTPNEIASAVAELQAIDPYFSPENFIERFKKIFNAVIMAHSAQDISKIQPMLSDSLYEQLKQKIAEEQNSGVRYDCRNIEINFANIIRIQNKNDIEELHVWVNAMVTEVPIDIKNGEILNKDAKPTMVAEVYTFLRRPSAKTLLKPGLLECTCPNCGAPIKIGQVTVCESCKGYIRSGNYDWVLSQITQACEWKYSNPDIIPAWKELQVLDRNLCIQQIEDKASVIFWMLKNMEINRKADALQRFATKNYHLTAQQLLGATKEYTNYENISLASVKLQAIEIKEFFVDLYLLVVWSGIPVKYDSNGRLPSVHRICRPYRNVLVLSRKRGAKTKRENTLTGAHCPNCGAPLTSNFDVNCQYCNTVLNDGSEWILKNVLTESDSKYSELSARRSAMVEEAASKIINKEKQIKIIKTQQAAEQPLLKKIDNEIHSATEILMIAAQMVMADGIIEEAELEFLKRLGVQTDIPEEKVMGILESVKDGTCPRISLTGKKLRESKVLFDIAIEMAFIDGTLSPEEEETIRNFGYEMGYTDAEITVRLNKERTKRAYPAS